jgi:hypothetical protein
MDEPSSAPTPRSPIDPRLDSWPVHLATAVATGLVTTYLPVQRWRRPARWVLHGGTGVLAGGGMAYLLRRPDARPNVSREDEPRAPLAPLPTAVTALAFAALVLGASRGGEAADVWVERRLAARGVRRPRAWMGVVAAGASLVMSVSDARRHAADSPSPTSTGA